MKNTKGHQIKPKKVKGNKNAEKNYKRVYNIKHKIKKVTQTKVHFWKDQLKNVARKRNKTEQTQITHIRNKKVCNYRICWHLKVRVYYEQLYANKFFKHEMDKFHENHSLQKL